MPAKSQPPSDRHPLGTHEGRHVRAARIALRKAGDGLSEAVKTDPVLIANGEIVYVLIEAQCVDVQFPVEDRKEPALGDCYRVHVLDAGTATIVDEDFAKEAIHEQALRDQARRDEERGQLRLSEEHPPDQELRGAHVLGDHDDGPIVGCSLCYPRDHDDED